MSNVKQQQIVTVFDDSGDTITAPANELLGVKVYRPSGKFEEYLIYAGEVNDLIVVRNTCNPEMKIYLQRTNRNANPIDHIVFPSPRIRRCFMWLRNNHIKCRIVERDNCDPTIEVLVHSTTTDFYLKLSDEEIENLANFYND